MTDESGFYRARVHLAIPGQPVEVLEGRVLHRDGEAVPLDAREIGEICEEWAAERSGAFPLENGAYLVLPEGIYQHAYFTLVPTDAP